MTKPIQDMTSWGPSGVLPLDSSALPTTMSSGMSTSHADRSSDDWPGSPTDVGRRVGDTMWEMAVVCEPAEALSLQFDVLQPLFLTVHDIGGSTSRRLLAGVAAAMHLPVHTLTIRRQGYGNILSRLEFVELPSGDTGQSHGPSVRLYSTQNSEAEEVAHRHVVDVLLGRASLAVTIIDGEVNPAALAVALAGMQNAMNRPAWTNRHALLLPLRPMPALKAQAAQLGREREIEVQISPPIVRPFDAWNAIRHRWNELADLGTSTMMPLDDPMSPLGKPVPRQPTAEETAAAVEALRLKLLAQRGQQDTPSTSPAEVRIDAAAKTIASMSKREATRANPPLPPPTPQAPARSTVASAVAAEAQPDFDDTPTIPAHLLSHDNDRLRVDEPAPPGPLQSLVTQCMEVSGIQSCAVVDLETRTVVAEQSVADPNGYASHGARLANSLRAAALGFRLPGRIPDAAMTFDQHHLLVRPVPGHDHLAFVAVLGREDVNVVVAKLKLQRIEKALFPEPGQAHDAR